MNALGTIPNMEKKSAKAEKFQGLTCKESTAKFSTLGSGCQLTWGAQQGCHPLPQEVWPRSLGTPTSFCDRNYCGMGSHFG